MRIHSNENLFAPPTREPHPSDRDDALTHEVCAIAGLVGFCITIGIALACGALPL